MNIDTIHRCCWISLWRWRPAKVAYRDIWSRGLRKDHRCAVCSRRSPKVAKQPSSMPSMRWSRMRKPCNIETWSFPARYRRTSEIAGTLRSGAIDVIGWPGCRIVQRSMAKWATPVGLNQNQALQVLVWSASPKQWLFLSTSCEKVGIMFGNPSDSRWPCPEVYASVRLDAPHETLKDGTNAMETEQA